MPKARFRDRGSRMDHAAGYGLLNIENAVRIRRNRRILTACFMGGLRKGTDTQNSASMAAMVFSTSSSPPSGPTIVETGFEP